MARKHLFTVAIISAFAALMVIVTPVVAQISPTKLLASEVTTARGAPIDAAEWSSRGSTTLGTTEVFPFASDLTSDQRVATFTQNIRILNRHATNFVCFAPVAYSAGCASDCPAATVTCSGTTTDGDGIAPGASYSVSINGTECPCVVASGASTAINATRVARFAN